MNLIALRRAVARVVATAGGAGYAPWAPGTWGTAVAAVLAWGLAPCSTAEMALITLTVTLVGTWATAEAQAQWGTHDDQRVVVDEVVGYWLTVLLVDRGSLAWLALGFVVFRLLDIIKPWPIRWIDRNVRGAIGVMADDLAAGLAGSVVLLAATKLVPLLSR